MRSKTAGRGKACPKDPSHCSGYCLCVERIRLNSNSPKTAHCIDAPSSTSEIRAAARHTIEGGYHYLSSCFDGLGGAEHQTRRFHAHLPAGRFLETETVLPGASSRSFWIKGSAWEFPDHENAETFVDRLVRNGVLVRDPLEDTVLRDRLQGLSPRTVRYRFMRATGLSQSRIRQIERAQQAATLLQRGTPIYDAVHEGGYFDQPHLSRSLKKWIGHTPAQILRSSAPV